MARLFAVAALVLALVGSVNAQNTDITEFQHARQFVDWFAENHFDATIEEIEERFTIFRDNVDFILTHNARYAQGLETYRVGLNQFADLTFEEYSSLVLNYRSNANTNSTALNVTVIAQPAEQLRYRFDRRSGSGPRINPWKWLCKRFRWAWWACRTEGSSSTGAADLSSSSSGSADLSSSSAPAWVSSSSGPSLLSSSSAESVLLSSSSTGSSYSSSAEAILLSSSSSGSADSSSSSSTGAAVMNATYVDWRDSGLVGPVRNQFACGASWAFAALASAESAWAQQAGEFATLSLEQVIACSGNGTESCTGEGSFNDVFSYLLNSTISFANETFAPLSENVISQCSSNATGANFTDIVRVAYGNESALFDAVTVTPSVAAAFNVAGRGFMFYEGGVFSDSACSNNTDSLNYAFSIVGFGRDARSGQDYWLVQNSIGLVWGSGGYARIARGNNTCGIATEAAYVRA